jgi:zinc transport system ATP-binding protein
MLYYYNLRNVITYDKFPVNIALPYGYESCTMPMTNRSLVELRDVGVKRDGRWLVRGVSLSVDEGEIVTLIGPNGSGKSTTAKLALGVLRPDEGKVKTAPGLVVSYVPQKIAIDWTLPLRVEHFMRLTNAISDADISSALAATGVEHLLKQDMRVLSGGEFQRVLIARAIARKPRLLVLDEPVQGVDFTGETELYELIKTLRDDLGCGIVLISHDLHVVMAATDKVICLNGHVCCSGTPRLVAESAEYKALFGHQLAPGLALYEHRHDHTHHSDGSMSDDA